MNIKLRKTRASNIWNTLEFSINNLVFTSDLFNSKLKLFWNKNFRGIKRR